MRTPRVTLGLALAGPALALAACGGGAAIVGHAPTATAPHRSATAPAPATGGGSTQPAPATAGGTSTGGPAPAGTPSAPSGAAPVSPSAALNQLDSQLGSLDSTLNQVNQDLANAQGDN